MTDPGPVVFLASRNPGKIAEMRRILREVLPEVDVLGADDVAAYREPREDRPTFAGNALVKARAGLAACGLPSLADDSGLCVDALNGMPGVLSARWAGPPRSDQRNNELLLAQLVDVPDHRRGAHFTCAVALCWRTADGVREQVVEGRMSGRVIRGLRGGGGFGYDALFVADEHRQPELTSAQLPASEKDRISHRGRALRKAAPLVAAAVRDGARGSGGPGPPGSSSW